MAFISSKSTTIEGKKIPIQNSYFTKFNKEKTPFSVSSATTEVFKSNSGFNLSLPDRQEDKKNIYSTEEDFKLYLKPILGLQGFYQHISRQPYDKKGTFKGKRTYEINNAVQFE